MSTKRWTLPPEELQQIETFISEPRIRKLLIDLVGIESPSMHEARVLDYIEMQLAGYGRKAKGQRMGANRYNLIASSGIRSAKRALLNTHVDTVPLASSSQTAQSRGGYVYGRGACDAKGSVTAMLLSYIAVTQLLSADPPPVDLCFTVGEENSGDGSLRFIRDCPRYEWAIVGEPTELRVANCHAGFLEIVVNATSARSHAFQPAAEQSIIGVSELLLDVTRRTRRLGQKPMNLYVPSIDLSEQDQFWSTRPSCRVGMVVNTYSRSDVSFAIRIVRQSARSIERKHKGLRLGIKVADRDRGLDAGGNAQIVKLLSASIKAAGREARMSSLSSWTDASRFHSAGIPTVVFGPGSLRDAHRDRERVRVDDVRTASIALARTMLAWHRQNRV